MSGETNVARFVVSTRITVRDISTRTIRGAICILRSVNTELDYQTKTRAKTTYNTTDLLTPFREAALPTIA